jgi:hypothetical protein
MQGDAGQRCRTEMQDGDAGQTKQPPWEMQDRRNNPHEQQATAQWGLFRLSCIPVCISAGSMSRTARSFVHV